MRKILLLLLCLSLSRLTAQKPQFIVHALSLPKEIEYYDNQFSGLYISKSKLFLMSESRVQDKAEGKLYAINISDLDRKLIDTAYELPWKKYHIYNLETLRDKINAENQSYEGLEAFMIDSIGDVYFSVETATPSSNCYLLKGHLSDTAVILDGDFLTAMPKPVASDGAHIYNAGFESLAKIGGQFFALFEFNAFPVKNNAYLPVNHSSASHSTAQFLPVKKIPFRVTDITCTGKNHFTAINYFYKGEGEDVIYRPEPNDKKNNKLIMEKGKYRNYARLIDIAFTGKSFTWKPLWQFPIPYMDYNWEGIAAYNLGYFIINDKYSPLRPYRSTLLYLQKVE